MRYLDVYRQLLGVGKENERRKTRGEIEKEMLPGDVVVIQQRNMRFERGAAAAIFGEFGDGRRRVTESGKVVLVF